MPPWPCAWPEPGHSDDAELPDPFDGRLRHGHTVPSRLTSKTQGIDDALIQPCSGHATRQSLETYSRLALADAQQRYNDVIGNFPGLTSTIHARLGLVTRFLPS